MIPSSRPICLAAIAASLSPVSGAILLQSNFDSNDVGTIPSGWNASNPSGATTSVSSIGNGGNSLGILDTSTNSTSINTTIPANLSASNNLLRLAFEFRVDSYVSGQNSQNPRIILRDSTATGAGFIIGFSRNGLNDGDASTDNHLFASPHGNTTSSVASTGAGTAQIGLISGSGWDPGFDFGTYSASGTNETGGWISFDVTYDFNTGLVAGTATNGANSTAFSISINPGLTFSSGSFLFASPGSSGTAPNTVAATTTAYLDNVIVETIPEPSSAALSIAATCGFGLLRRRRGL